MLRFQRLQGDAHVACMLELTGVCLPCAGRVLLDSFISTQKQSVQRAMAKKFRKYVSYKRDFHDLVMAALQGLLRDQLRREQVSGLDPDRLGPAIAVQMRCACRQVPQSFC